MNTQLRSASRIAGALVGAGAATYTALVCSGWLRYGHAAPSATDERDELLDHFIPSYDVVERYRIRVAAPSSTTLAVAKDQDLLQLPLVRAIFKARELVMGASAKAADQPRGLLAQVQSLGWGVLAEVPDREVVVGAVTRPWEADVIFRAIPTDQFATFSEPGYVKIAWTLRADPSGDHSVFRTETRAVATDPAARAKFRRYWAFVAPGVAAIRWLSLGPLKRDAERRAAMAPLQAVPS